MFVDVRRLVFTAALLGLGGLGWTMLHDDADLLEHATELACRGRVCNAALEKKTRDLFGWTFTFTAYGDQNLSVDVTCTRVLWVAGDYRCDVSGAAHAADSRFERR